MLINRRAVLLSLIPAPALAQARRARRVAVLHSVSVGPSVNAIRILREAWERMGFVTGTDILLRAPDGGDLGLPALLDELLAFDPGALIAIGAPAVMVATRHGGGVPIIAVDLETDPVAAGLAASAARPGGTVTGLFLDQPSMAAKWLDLLREAAPGIAHIVFLWEPTTGSHQLRAAELQAVRRGLTSTTVNPFADTDHAAVLARFDRVRTGVVTLTAPGYARILGPLSAALRAAGLPSITFLSNLVGRGMLMGYGPDQDHYYSRIMQIVDRVLAGESPAVIPLERPTRFRFAIDARVADALNLSLSPALLAQADEIIE